MRWLRLVGRLVAVLLLGGATGLALAACALERRVEPAPLPSPRRIGPSGIVPRS